MAGDVFNSADPESLLIRSTGILAIPSATAGDVLTVQADKTIAADPAALPAGTYAQVVSVPITASEILNLRAAPVTIVAAPGAGFYVNITFCCLSFTPGATPYTPGAGAFLVVTPTPAASFGGAWGWEVAAAGLIDSATAQVVVSTATTAGAAIGAGAVLVPTTDMENLPWQLTNDRAVEHTGGDGTLVVTVSYAICRV